MQDALTAVERIDKPIITLIDGHCFGAALELVLACDFRIGTKNLQISCSEAFIGLIPDFGGTTRLVKNFGPSIAKKIILFAGRLTGKQVLELGLLDWVVSANELEHKGFELAKKLLENAPLAVMIAKRVINKIYGQTDEVALMIEQLVQLELLQSEDLIEGISQD